MGTPQIKFTDLSQCGGCDTGDSSDSEESGKDCTPSDNKRGSNPEQAWTSNNENTTLDKILLETSQASEDEQPATAASGEGNCHCVCAIIPLDKRPLISQAYGSSDFMFVDPAPVVLPMLDDDGRLRLPVFEAGDDS